MNSCPSREHQSVELSPGFAQRAARLVRPVTSTCASSFARQGMLSVFDQGVVSMTSFLTSVIVARATSREDLGVYYLALTLFFLARGVQTQILTAPYLFFCHRRQGSDSAKYTGSVLVHQFVYAALVAVCLLGVAVAIQLGLGPRDLGPVVWVLLGVAPLLLLREFHRQHSLSRLKVARALAFDVPHALLQVGSLLLLWRFVGLSVAGVYAVMGIAAALVCLPWFVLQRRRWHIERGCIAADWRQNWSFARWTLASHLAGCSTPYIMPWIVVAAAGSGAAGLYGACGTLAGVAGIFVMGLGNYLAPKARREFAVEGKAALCRTLARGAAVFGVVVGGLCLLSLAVGEQVVVLVYDRQCAGGGAILTLLMLSLLAISLQMVAGSGLWAIGRPKATLLPDVCVLVVTLGAAAVAVGPLGPTGAALASLAGAVTGAVLKTSCFLQLIRSVPLETACA
ncbi:MAG: hypothetical protein JXB62_11180 [Pirellulales bacterium]|nr:hypothetical protein [Pirellulales bacterium]